LPTAIHYSTHIIPYCLHRKTLGCSSIATAHCPPANTYSLTHV
jgi:hypothetical protein